MKCKMSQTFASHWVAPPSEPMDLSCSVVSREVTASAAASTRHDTHLGHSGFSEYKESPLDLSMTSPRPHYGSHSAHAHVYPHTRHTQDGADLDNYDYRYRSPDIHTDTESGYNSNWNRRSPAYNPCNSGYETPCTSRDTYYYDNYHSGSATSSYELNYGTNWHEPQTESALNTSHYKSSTRTHRSPTHANSYRPYRYPIESRYGTDKTPSPDYYRHPYTAEYERYTRECYGKPPEQDACDVSGECPENVSTRHLACHSSGGGFTYTLPKGGDTDNKRKTAGGKAHLKYNITGGRRAAPSSEYHTKHDTRKAYNDGALPVNNAHVISSNTHCAGGVVVASSNAHGKNNPEEIRPITIPLHMLGDISLDDLNKPDMEQKTDVSDDNEACGTADRPIKNELDETASDLMCSQDETRVAIKKEIP